MIQANEFYQALLKLKDVEILTTEALSIFAFRLKKYDTYDLADYLRDKNWTVVNTINPKAISFTITNGKANFGSSNDFYIANQSFAVELVKEIEVYIYEYAEKNKTFDKGIKEFYEDKELLKKFIEMKHHVPLITNITE